MNTLPSDLVSFIFEKLQEKIINGSYESDQKLVISQIAKEFNMSIIPVREALAKLSTVGLVVFTPNHGYRVSPNLSQKEFVDLFYTRLIIDIAAIPSLISNVTPKDIEKLKQLNANMANNVYGSDHYEQFKKFMVLNAEFHRILILISRNKYLQKLYSELYIEMFISRHIINSDIGFEKLVHGHDKIISALESRDASALKQEYIDHLNEGVNLIFGYRSNIKLDSGVL
ncbi:GntR family transcriptional regulator [Alteromonas sp. M12]|uniref:GntR family transcriptional regulator n=1 Tax=Alteromonas sp. M12 TaxID=3135644 RepID=UPI00319DB757